MLVEKVLNNNVISSLDEDNHEVILVGHGIGWKAKVGQAVDETKIEKVFRMDTQDSTNKLEQLLLEVTEESVNASIQIVDYASEKLRKKLNANVYITLTDHINFAVERMQKGLEFRNMLIWETRKLYPEEYAVGIHALDIIQNVMGIRLPKDEAGSIAIHIVNAEYDSSMEKTVKMTSIIQQSLNIIRYTFRVEYDENSLNYQRLVTHLLFFAQRD
ncbi:MAG: PRD domain-containing protein, partial [Butyricicoccus sp.]